MNKAWTATACNHGHESLTEFFSYAKWSNERSNRKLCINANMKLFLVSWWRSCEKVPARNIHKKQKKTKTKLVERKKLFYFKNALIFAIIWSEQMKVDKVFHVKQQTSLLKTWQGRGVAQIIGRVFLLTPWQWQNITNNSNCNWHIVYTVQFIPISKKN